MGTNLGRKGQTPAPVGPLDPQSPGAGEHQGHPWETGCRHPWETGCRQAAACRLRAEYYSCI